jgi:protein SCO1/2
LLIGLLFCCALVRADTVRTNSDRAGLTDQNSSTPKMTETPTNAPQVRTATASARNPLLDFKFTNELGQPVSLSDFKGQALGITFFFTRCPLPNFCPRLSKNFQEASEKLAAMPGAPKNWHFLSVTFDPQHDTPEVLRRYGEKYHSNPERWNFLTGPEDKINELARQSGIEIVHEKDGSVNHNFRTMIIDASGRLQTVFPFGGNLSELIVNEMLRACAATNPPVASNKSTVEMREN